MFCDQARIHDIVICVLLWTQELKILMLMLIITRECLWLLLFITKTKMRERKILKLERENYGKTGTELHIKVSINMASASSCVVNTV